MRAQFRLLRKRTNAALSSVRRGLVVFDSTTKRCFRWWMAAGLVGGLLPIVSGYFFGLLVDEVDHSQASNRTLMAFWSLVAGYGAIRVVNELSSYIQQICMRRLWLHVGRTFERLDSRMRSRLDVAALEDDATQSTLIKAQETGTYRLANAITSFGEVAFSMLTVTVALITLSQNYLISTLIIILASCFPLLVEMSFGEELWGIWQARPDRRRKYYTFQNLLSNKYARPDLQSFDTADYFCKRSEQIYDEFQSEELQAETKKIRWGLFASLISFASSMSVTIILFNDCLHGRISVGALSFLVGVSSSLSFGLARAFGSAGVFLQNGRLATPLLNSSELKPLILWPTEGKNLTSSQAPRIELKQVFFSYPGSQKPALNGLSLTIEPGSTLALVGENGSGKSSLVKLILRFYDPTAGQILANTHALSELGRQDWYDRLAYMPQSSYVYPVSIEDSIGLGHYRRERQSEQIKVAAELALIEQKIMSLPGQFATQIGKEMRGVEFSGGEYQRLAIAKAVYRILTAPHGMILVLDEPGANLDPEAEINLVDRLLSFKQQGHTVLIVSHRFSTVRKADKIVVLGSGQVIEQGNHQELLNLKGRYADLFEKQAKGYQ